MRPSSGFTLIELIVTIAVAGILLALAVPSFRETTLNNQRAARVNELVSDLNFARGQALALRSPATICRSSNSDANSPTCGSGAGWEEGWVTFRDNDGDGAFDAGDQVLRRHGALISAEEVARPANQRFSIRGNNNIVNRATFEPSGISGNNGTLVVCDLRNDFRLARVVELAVGGRAESYDAFSDRVAGTRDPRLEAGVTDCQR